jgi:hypothetical protein
MLNSPSHLRFVGVAVALTALSALQMPQLAAGAGSDMEHGTHPHQHGAVVDMDTSGKRLESYQHHHEMSAEERAGLRAKVALYRGMTDREMDLNMSSMGPDYEWYVSDRGMKGTVGVLVLSHGVGENSDLILRKAYEPMAKKRPTAIGFGMSMMGATHLQSAVDDLVAHGARKIVLLDEGTTTEYNTITRQWQYIFGVRDNSTYLPVTRVKAPVKFIWAGHFNDSPIITQILYDHAKEVSRNAANELLVIVGHGPEDVSDNGPDLKILQPHVERIKARKEFADVRIINIQDDALKPIRESNVRTLRRWIEQATRQGQRVIVVAIAAASYGVQTHIKQDLRGLQYTFAEKGLAEHPRFIEWAESAVDEALSKTKS